MIRRRAPRTCSRAVLEVDACSHRGETKPARRARRRTLTGLFRPALPVGAECALGWRSIFDGAHKSSTPNPSRVPGEGGRTEMPRSRSADRGNDLLTHDIDRLEPLRPLFDLELDHLVLEQATPPLSGDLR